MNKTFLVKIDNQIFCGKCGIEIFSEDREISRHEKQDNVQFINKVNAYNLEDIKAYYLKALGDHLELKIIQATGNKHSFNGIVWECIYSCKFYNNSNQYKEHGEGSLNEWLEYLECNMLLDVYSPTDLNMNEEPDFITVNRVFSGVGYIKSITEFIKIYLSKKLCCHDINLSLIRKLKPIKPDFNIKLRDMNSQTIYFCQLREDFISDDVLFSACCMVLEIKENMFNILSKCYLYISKDYILNPSSFNLLEFLNHNVIYGRFRYSAFQTKYPEIKLKEYIESGGKKYLDFLISENNNSHLELVGKAGLGYLSNKLEKLYRINHDGKNLKDIFEMPIKALRSINNEDLIELLDDSLLDLLKKTYTIQPAVFDEPINKTLVMFLNDNLESKVSRIQSFKCNSKSLLTYIRYCRNLTIEEYTLFVDYTNMCSQTGLWPYKKFPEINNLKNAHDVIMNYLREKQTSEEAEGFAIALENPDYINLIDLPTTSFYDNSKFILLMPRTANDLVDESYQMRNCVRSYIRTVSLGRTFILFLRKKNSKSKSHTTIEISTDYVLRQVKGKGNSYPTAEIIDWISQWTVDKGIISSRCYDLF